MARYVLLAASCAYAVNGVTGGRRDAMMLHGTTLDFRRACPTCPAWLHRRITGDGRSGSAASKLGEVFAATEQAACLRAIQRFRIGREEQQELEVRRAKDAEAGAMHSRF